MNAPPIFKLLRDDKIYAVYVWDEKKGEPQLEVASPAAVAEGFRLETAEEIVGYDLLVGFRFKRKYPH